jgi:hypothetical protein
MSDLPPDLFPQGSIPQVLADKKEQGVFPRMDTMGTSTDSRTAPSNEVK